MSSTQHQLIEQCATRLRGIVEALDNIHDTSPQRWSTDLDDVHSSAESLLALINDQAPPSDAERWKEQFACMQLQRDHHRERADAALARVAELTATRNRYGVDAHYFNKNLQRILRDFESFTPGELARSLIILAKVADEKVVAQHSVPEEFSFEYRHPNGECHTVTVSREQVINEMPDFLFEALCSKLCNCEPVGETNVVECRCDEYAEEFKLIAAAPGNEGV
ncbi:hypothetical protein [Pseudomonas aeruginosa]|uniref:hypothetical protein n=1 Tax=Pseudomonas aeruginosa TaxID=287 RepID=UPI000F61B0B7|nr:hypothetical protein [Pseudomonas aeruginosa]RRJ44421.1 hypothetical protein EIM02_03495 [Pseudomonas aeruginosa]